MDTDVFKPLPDEDKKYEILFGGSFFRDAFPKDRIRLIRHLKDKGYNIQVVGDGWPEDIEAIPRKGVIEYNRMMNQSRVTIGMSHFNDVAYYTSNRLYQAMATGVPHISWHAPFIADRFEEGYLEVKSYDEIKKILDFLLSSEFWRKTVGNCQHREILNNHTLLHAWQRMKAIIKDNLK